MNDSQRVIILGSSGQLGSEFKFNLNFNNSFDVIYFNREDCDISDFDETFLKISKYNPDYIINCAAYTKVDMAESEKEMCNTVNNISVENLANIAKQLKSVLIHFSTDYVFDGSGSTPIIEDELKCPINHYGLTKHLGEEAIIKTLTKFFIFRISWVYGLNGSNFPKTMIELFKKNNEVSIVNDQIGCPTPTSLVVDVIIKIIKNHNAQNNYGVFNLSPNGYCTWFDIGNFILNDRYSSKSIIIKPVNSDYFNLDARRPKYSVLNNQKIVKTFDITFEKWDKYLKKFLKNFDKIK